MFNYKDLIESVKEIRRYLMEDVEDKNYVSLYTVENWLVLYWTNEYNDLLDDIKSLDSLRMAEYDAKIQPNKDLLYIKLKEASVENAETIRNRINESGLSSEYKMFLTLNFENLIADVQADEYVIDTLNNFAEVFLSKYPDSEYSDFTRKHIRYKLISSDWGFGYELHLGYGIFTGALRDNYTNNAPLMGLALDIFYKKAELSLRCNFGFNKNRKDINYSSGVFEKKSKTRTYFPEVSLGYAVADYDRFKISPFIGIGGVSISPTENVIKEIPELKEVSLKMTTAYLIGVNLDIALGKKNTPAYRPKANLPLRVRYEYCFPRFEKKYDGLSGNMHYITIGIMVISRAVKREI